MKWRLHLLSLHHQAHLMDQHMRGMLVSPFSTEQDDVKPDLDDLDSSRSSPAFRTASVSPPITEPPRMHPRLFDANPPQLEPLDLSIKSAFCFIPNEPVLLPCQLCSKAFSSPSSLQKHVKNAHSTAKTKYRCSRCDKTYGSSAALNMHERTHSGGCACSFCGKVFSRPWLLQGHIRTHTGEKPFSCDICHKRFADKSNLRAHTQTHSSLKPYSCTNCGKAFALKSYLSKHEESTCFRRRVLQ